MYRYPFFYIRIIWPSSDFFFKITYISQLLRDAKLIFLHVPLLFFSLKNFSRRHICIRWLWDHKPPTQFFCKSHLLNKILNLFFSNQNQAWKIRSSPLMLEIRKHFCQKEKTNLFIHFCITYISQLLRDPKFIFFTCTTLLKGDMKGVYVLRWLWDPKPLTQFFCKSLLLNKILNLFFLDQKLSKIKQNNLITSLYEKFWVLPLC